jgi:hypothetical protein
LPATACHNFRRPLPSPSIHNLLRLAEKAELSLTDDIKKQLVTITAFNINARYDDYKMSFKKKCTLAAQIDSRFEPHPISHDDFDSGNPFVVEIKKTGIEVAAYGKRN